MSLHYDSRAERNEVETERRSRNDMMIHYRTIYKSKTNLLRMFNAHRTYNPIMNRKNSSMVFLVLGLAFLTIGLATDNTAFSWIAIAFVVLSLVMGGRWMRPRK